MNTRRYFRERDFLRRDDLRPTRLQLEQMKAAASLVLSSPRCQKEPQYL